ncbi:LacI family DNA-binding transcriptional regulator [Plantactinospora sp. GCM10030261]
MPARRGDAATLRDVARLAGVSVKTVSNVVNGYPHVSEDVRRRVSTAVEQLCYRPNPSARNLRTGRTGTLALVLAPDVPYADRLTQAVVDAAALAGFRVVIVPIDLAGALPVDGVLLCADVVAADVLDAWLGTGTALVLLGVRRDERFDHVAIDHARAARDATDHLVRLGRRRIAAIGARPGEPDTRTAGYRLALSRAGIAPHPGYLRPAWRHRPGEGYRAAMDLFAHDHRPDAVFCYSDRLAIGVLGAAVDAGLRVPDDVAVIGMGEAEEGRFLRPALSTVSVDTSALARAAVTRIAARLGQAPWAVPTGRTLSATTSDPQPAAPVTVTVPHRLLRRESCGGSRCY